MAFEGLSSRLQEITRKIKGEARITESNMKDMLREVKLALLEADVNYKIVKEFIASVQEKALGQDVLKSLKPGEQVVKIVRDELTELLGGTDSKINISSNPPTIIMLVGLQGAGKTTFLNILSNFIPREERIITIEDSAELQIRQVPNLVRLEARNANVEGKNQVTIRDLVKSSLRMRPSRIIVGEIRDAAAIDLLSAMNTGHDGSLSTGHANSPRDMLNRLETLVLMGMDIPLAAVRQQIASGIDILVHLGRLRDGSRRVLQIDEIVGIENERVSLQTLFQFQEK